MHAGLKVALGVVFSAFLAVVPALGQTAQGPAAISYSAVAVHGYPGQGESRGVVVRSGQNMRLEYQQDGRNVVQILFPTAGKMFILDPAAKTYMEIDGPAVPVVAEDAYTSPCADSAQASRCQLVGKDVVSGIQVEHWLIATGQQGQQMSILWDPTRRRALRQDMPDGSSLQMTFRAMEVVSGRNTEHWTMQLSAPGQPVRSGDWWFDPELRVTVKEVLPSGETRALEEIHVGQVDPALFQVPAGWEKKELPQQPQGGAPSGN